MSIPYHHLAPLSIEILHLFHFHENLPQYFVIIAQLYFCFSYAIL